MNIRMAFLAAAALTVIAGPAAARCSQPYAPVVKAPAGATKQDIANLRNDVAAFIAASDVYQACVVAAKGTQAQLHANQVEKERVGREFNALARAFNNGGKS